MYLHSHNKAIQVVLAVGLLTILVLTGSCRKHHGIPDARSKGGYNLLVITLDTTRADRLGAYGCSAAHTPNLDWLAREGVMFLNSHTSVPLTLPAHCTLFTGREPPGHQVRVNGTYLLRPEETTLAEVMKSAGFNTKAVIASFVLEGKFGLQQGFDNYDDSLDITKTKTNYSSEIPAAQVFAKFKSWLNQRQTGRFFCWLHFYDPHTPYKPSRYWAEQFPNNSYNAEIAFMDENIGYVIQTLKQKDLLKKTLIVAVADHGEGFGEHAESGHGIFGYEETLRIPLIFYQPSLLPGGRTVSQNVGLVDVLPTILEMFRLPLPAGVQGHSFAKLLTTDMHDTATEYYFETMYGMEEFGWAPLNGLRRDSFKYISLPEPELYDLRTDPEERQNLYFKKNALAKELANDLRERLQKITNKNQVLRHKLSGQDQEKLRTLGYLATVSKTTANNATAEDPKKGIVMLNRFSKIISDIEKKDFIAAQKSLDEMHSAGVHKIMPQYYDRLYDFYFAQNDHKSAVKILQEAIVFYPDVTRFKYLLAVIYEKQGDSKAAESLAREVLAQDALFTQAHTMLSKICRKNGSLLQAKYHMQQAIMLEPRNNWLLLELANLQFDSGELSEAMKTIKPLLTESSITGAPENGTMRREIASLLVKLGDSNQAKSILEDVTKINKNDAEAWTQLGLAQLAEADEEQAMLSLQKAVNIAPGQALALSGLGTLYLNQFRRLKNRETLSQAEDYYLSSHKADPLLVTAINGLGIINLYNGKFSQAIANWREVIRIDPSFVNAYFNLAIIALNAGRKHEARRYLETLHTKYDSRLNSSERNQLLELLNETGR